jgi:hypothetical protein
MLKTIFISCSVLSFSLLFSQETILTDTVKNNTTSINQDNRINTLKETYTSSFKLMGYRIQIYSGDQRQPARQARLSFTQKYKTVKAHHDYDQPYFKVRVGDFKTKIEALKFKNNLIKHFPNCFIVRTEIDFKESDN